MEEQETPANEINGGRITPDPPETTATSADELVETDSQTDRTAPAAESPLLALPAPEAQEGAVADSGQDLPELTPEERERINKYRKFKKVDGATYRRVNQFLRKHTHITAREWAIARLCTDFSTRSGAEMTFIGQNLPDLIPFMTDTYTPQAVNQARNSFKRKVRKAGATFFYGALCGFFTADELDDILFEASEVARFLLEVEDTSIDIDEEIDVEDRITEVMRSVAEAASRIRQNKPGEGIEK